MPEHLIRVFDVETSALMRVEDAAELIEVASTDLVLCVDGASRTFEVGETYVERFGCSHEMKPEVIAVHHIRNEDIAGLPLCTDEDLRRILNRGEAPTYAGAHKVEYERQWFTDDVCGPVKWLDSFKAAKHLCDGPYGNQVLKYALGFGNLPHDRCMPPHAAGPDSYVTAHLLGRMLVDSTGQQIEAWTREPEFHPTCPIGDKQGWKGKPWNVIDHGFLDWMLKQPTMEPDLKHAARLEIDRRRNHLMANTIETKKD